MHALFTITVVLFQPRDVRNIGAVVRAMKNMGFTRLRLVRPAPFDPADLRGIAHRSDDILSELAVYDTLDTALADMHHVVGTSEHVHAERPLRTDVRAVAAELAVRAATNQVALLFGPEDNGLSHSELDRCHQIVRLPTAADYPSLNLAQAALLLLYELRMAADLPAPATAPHVPATADELTRTLEALAAAVDAAGFVKSGAGARTLRTLRALVYRAQPNSREAALLAALSREIARKLRQDHADDA